MTVRLSKSTYSSEVRVHTENPFEARTYKFESVVDRDDTLVPTSASPEPTPRVIDELEAEGYTVLSRDEVHIVNESGWAVPHVHAAYADEPGVVRVGVISNPDLFDGCWAEALDADGTSQYAFHRVDADHIGGDCVVYVGASTGVNYPSEVSLDDVPVEVVDEVEDEGFTVVTGVDAGWETWEGRPEWSETYVDASDAEPVRGD